MYTVKQLSSLAGVSTRTLHYYDEIGLLKPTTIEENGYRRYGEQAVYLLQQILFYKEMGFSLEKYPRDGWTAGLQSIAGTGAAQVSAA